MNWLIFGAYTISTLALAIAAGTRLRLESDALRREQEKEQEEMIDKERRKNVKAQSR